LPVRFFPLWSIFFVLFKSFRPSCHFYVPYYRPYDKHNTNIHAPSEIRTHDPSKRAAEDPRLRPHGHWDRQGFEPRTVLPVA
jgi:hypothetical protein